MSTSFQGGWSVKRCPPHFVHHLRLLCGVLANPPMLWAPFVMRRFSGFQRLKALIGPGGPRAAGFAMAVAHGSGLAGNFELHLAAEAAAGQSVYSPCSGSCKIARESWACRKQSNEPRPPRE